jgi:hypothetical protein
MRERQNKIPLTLTQWEVDVIVNALNMLVQSPIVSEHEAFVVDDVIQTIKTQVPQS